MTAPVHCFHQSIGGRAYEIEVVPVSNRWRAQLRRVPGVPTAMMPFYGQTPDDAARQLSEWLSRAHERHASHSGYSAEPGQPRSPIRS